MEMDFVSLVQVGQGFSSDRPGQRSTETFPTGLSDGEIMFENHGNAGNWSVLANLLHIDPFQAFPLIFKQYFPIGKACRERSRRSLDLGFEDYSNF